MKVKDSPIEHIVVLALENRSFSNMLGYLPKKGHLEDLVGLQGNESNLLDPFDPESKKFFVKEGANYRLKPDLAPGHSLRAANWQQAGRKEGPSKEYPALNNGYVKQHHNEILSLRKNQEPTDAELRTVMDCFSPQQVPAISTLAQEFYLCDHWFSSVPGPTMPNRLFMHMATSGGYAHNAWNKFWDQRTIYNSLEEAGNTWRFYYSNMCFALHFNQIRKERSNFRFFDDYFASDVEAGDLADYTFLSPRFISEEGIKGANTAHPPSDVRLSELLIATVYDILRRNEDVWKKTLLLIVYDEHGGFYDNVIPPHNVPNPDGLVSPIAGDDSFAPDFDFTRLGIRVPAILVSPWLPKQVDHSQYEHSSIPATLREFFGLGNFLTKRDEAANTFTHLLKGDLSYRDDTPERLPIPEQPTDEEVMRMAEEPIDEIQREIINSSFALHPDYTHPSELTITSQKEAHDFAREAIHKHLKMADKKK
jgi:phospholipase C